MTNQHEHNEITFSDVLQCISEKKGKLILFTVFGALLALTIALFQPPRFEAESSFKEQNNGLQGDSGKASYLSMLMGTGELNEGALSAFRSRRLTEEVVRKRNLQAIIRLEPKWKTRLTYPSENLNIEWAYLFDDLVPVPVKNPIPITVESLEYDEDFPTYLTIKMSSEDSFVVIDEQGEEIDVGSLYKPFRAETYSFTLTKSIPQSIADREFYVELMPLSYITKKLAKQLTVEEDSKDESLVNLTFRHNDREESMAFLNDLMEAYHNFQRDEQRRIAEEQVSYINIRQEQTEDQLRDMMEKHAQTLSSNMSNMDLLIQNQENYAQKLLNINLELSRLANVKKQGTAYYDRSGTETGDNLVINGILNEIRTLEHQRETLKTSTAKKIPIDPSMETEFANLDLPTANHLYSEQCKGMNYLEGECRQQQFVLEQLDQPQFEITSLSTVNEDRVSNDIIARAIQIELMLKDQNNRTTRELERLREELEQQKNFLSSHVQESHRILQERKKYTAQKIQSLQTISLDLIEKKILLLNKQLSQYVEDRIKTLTQEKNTLKTQQVIIQKEMQKLPSKWAAQKMVEQQLITNQAIAKELASMMESKMASAQIELSQSGPLDYAYSPILKHRPHLILFTMLGGILTFLLALTWNLLKIHKKPGSIA